LARNVAKLYKAVLPHPTASAYTALVHIIATLDARIRLLTQKPDITAVMGDVEKLVGTSIATKEYIIREALTYDTSRQVDLSKIDFDALRAKFATGYKHTEVEKLRGDIENKLDSMVKRNKSRTNYQEKFQRLIAEYNTGSMNVDVLFERLVQFVTQELNVEDQRHIVEQLSEEELAIFDLLAQPDMTLSAKEKAEIKKVVRQLLETLKREKLVLDWRKKQQAQAAVRKTVRDMFYHALPPSSTRELCELAYTAVYQHIYDSYYGMGQSVYANAS
jgi:type I restriction enzyme R subunit